MHKQFSKSILASAIALAILGTSAAAGAATMSQDVIDARQETQIWTTYALSPYLRANDLKVSVDSGKATLTGNVEEGVNKDLAKQIALGVEGIKKSTIRSWCSPTTLRPSDPRRGPTAKRWTTPVSARPSSRNWIGASTPMA